MNTYFDTWLGDLLAEDDLINVDDPRLDAILSRDDAGLGSCVVAILSSNDPREPNFAALGRMIRAGSREDLVAIVNRKGRR